MQRLGPALTSTGIAADQLRAWSSHCFRRGSGIDMLNRAGLAAMLEHGQWRSPRSAEPYATRDEQEAALLANAVGAIDASDDDV